MLTVDINSFSYSDKEILNNISFQLEKGKHLAILGESGCGKSTLLHLIYGLLNLENGSISWDEKQLLGPQYNLVPGETFIKLVAQEFDVMPYITVAENVATHLSRLNEAQDRIRVKELLKVVGLQDFSEILVKNLSGGQKQRVALAKALAKKPQLLLLDEPFSSIDTFRKNQLRRSLFSYLKENKIACITATHDSEEALAFSDLILILNQGTTDVLGTPEAVYSQLINEYRAGFFGEVNRLPASTFSSEKNKEDLVLLPHQLQLSSKKTSVEAIVENSYFKGRHYLIHVKWNKRDLFFEHFENLEPGYKLNLDLK